MADQKSNIKNQISKTNTSRSSKPALSMADLLNSAKSQFITLHKGDSIKGRITKLTSSEILVDINAKTDAVVLEKEKKNMRSIMSNFKVGDEVFVNVLNPESDMGHPVVSLRRYIEDLMWERLSKLQKQYESVEVMVNEMTKGGFIVSTKDGISGFLPNSHTSFISQPVNSDGSQNISRGMVQNPGDFLGRKIDVFVLELNRQFRKIIFSQKPVLSIQSFEETIKNLKIEQKINAIVSNITPFGIFVSMPVSDNKYVDGLIHISEISWDKVLNIEEMFEVGQTVEVIIIGFDKDAKRVDLSLKRKTADPFEDLVKKFSVDQKISATVSKILPAGVILNLMSTTSSSPDKDQIEGFIRREKIPPNVSYKEGDKISATVTQIDIKKRRIILVPVLLEKFVGYK